MEQEYNKFLKYLYEGVYVVDKNRKIIFWNEGSEAITGYSKEEVVNNNCYNNILRHVDENGKQLCFDGCPLQNTLNTGNINEANVFLHHKEGHRVPVSVKSLPIYDGDEIVASVEVFTDMNYRKDTYKENRKLKRELSTDQLTQIPNRRYLDFHLENLLNEYKQFEKVFGILFVDIDHFKNVNDTYGHNIGDEVLKLVSNTLKLNIRTNDKVGRWGGEEFIAIIKVDNNELLQQVADKIRILVSASSYRLEDGKDLAVTISIGGSLIKPEDSITDLIERADANMYISKTTGRNKVTIK